MSSLLDIVGVVHMDPIVAGALLLVGVFLAYSLRADFGRYSVITVGTFRRVQRTSVRRRGRECEDCERQIERGEQREYYKEFVLFGAPLFRYGGGTNYYCYDHAEWSIRHELQAVEETERSSLGTTLAELCSAERNGRAAKTDENPFKNVSSSVGVVGSAFELASVMLVVVIAAAVASMISGEVHAALPDESEESLVEKQR